LIYPTSMPANAPVPELCAFGRYLAQVLAEASAGS
jgi:hypothetical protein